MSPSNRTQSWWTTIESKLRHRTSLLFEKLIGVDFSRTLDTMDLGYDNSIVIRSSPSGNHYLSSLLDDLPIRAGDNILDIGCGKGSAMRMLLRYPFSTVDGLELAPEIAAVAERNLARLRLHRAHIFNVNAIDFDLYQKYNFFYMYHPFPNSVMAPVIEAIKIARSMQAETIIIYTNPVCHALIEAAGFSKLRVYPDQWGNGMFVYSNRPDSGRGFRR